MIDQCSACEKQFEREQLELISLPARSAMWLCAECETKEKLAYYQKAFENNQNALESLKSENNLFRSIMLRPNTMESIANEPLTSSPRFYIAQSRQGWEAMSLDTILFWLDVYQKYAECFADIANRKASKDQIQKALKANAKKQQIEVKKVQESKANKTVSERKKMTAEEKAIHGLVKSLGVSEEVAKSMIKASFS